ncbi:hypothetical protein HMPREF3053_07675 [Corynebacterium sp. HMSC064E07]|nr:hypothetical protein HMPREF3053_07675 [Corynebacterium sp. HMSC064E07]
MPGNNRRQAKKEIAVMGAKVAKLNIEGTDTGINIDVDGASEGIHIEYEILANVMAVIVQEALDATKHDQGN